MQEEQVRKALRILAEEDRHLEAPPRVEAALLEAFRTQKRGASTRKIAVWLTTAAAAAALVIGYSLREPEIATLSFTLPAPPSPELTRQPQRILQAERQPTRAVAPREVVTEFFSLADTAPPFESGALLRVRVPASTMRSVGLPVREDRWQDSVSADVLIGQEGIVRAIRFVNFEQ